MCSEGIFVGYPDLTFACKTLVSHSALSLGGGDYDRTLRRKLREVAACHGVDMVPYHRDQDGFCGDIAGDITCPATPRNSFDAMSFRHIFRHQGWKRVLSNTVEPLDVYWVLGAKNCKLNKMGVRPRQKKKNLSVRPAAYIVGLTHQGRAITPKLTPPSDTSHLAQAQANNVTLGVEAVVDCGGRPHIMHVACRQHCKSEYPLLCELFLLETHELLHF
ncbi:hypothetical protein K438DRAFT_1749922 [Mycena galopus ATCC 62051]|nr:hypothetical protein K438DRAFT_1749922 [Mycena galopus ATCC 62051]